MIDILKDIVDSDELSLIRFLLANTNLNISCGTETTQIKTDIRTPQGDSLSPLLFIVYLEAALRDLRQKLPTSTRFQPCELVYADDCDLVFDTEQEARDSVPIIVETFGRWNLKVNASKTEFTTVNRNSSEWYKTRKLGSLLNDGKDIDRRKQLASAAFANFKSLWISRNKTIQEDKLLGLYNSLVLPILTYNSGTWSPTKSQANKLDSFHRTQLRRLLGIHWPNIISNSDLYKRCNCRPISESLPRQRLQLLGHIIRRPQNIPARLAIQGYFSPNDSPKFRGRPPSNIVSTLNNDITLATASKIPHTDHSYCKKSELSLKNLGDLRNVEAAAENRDYWKSFTKRMS